MRRLLIIVALVILVLFVLHLPSPVAPETAHDAGYRTGRFLASREGLVLVLGSIVLALVWAARRDRGV